MRDAASRCGDAVMPMPLQTARSNIHDGTSMRSPAASRLQRQNVAGASPDHPVDADDAPEPGMPRIEDLALHRPVGVIARC